MKFYTSLIVLLICTYVAVAQPFVLVPAELPAIGRSAVAFADFDNDHDLDLVMNGLDASSNAIGKVFLNQQGEFVESETGISGLYNSALAVADYDHDGNIDFVVTGEDQQGNATRLYRNNGDATFVLVEAGFYAAGADGDLAWGDYDNDSWPDLVISGGWDTKLYHNNGNGTFQEVNAGFTIMNSPSVDWGDFDNDGDPDLLMVGDAVLPEAKKAFEVLSLVDWNEDGSALLIKHRSGKLYDGIHASKTMVVDWPSLEVKSFPQVEEAVRFYWTTRPMEPALERLRWGVEPVGWQPSSNTIVELEAWGYAPTARYYLGHWQLNIATQSVTLMDGMKTTFPVAQNGAWVLP